MAKISKTLELFHGYNGDIPSEELDRVIARVHRLELAHRRLQGAHKRLIQGLRSLRARMVLVRTNAEIVHDVLADAVDDDG